MCWPLFQVLMSQGTIQVREGKLRSPVSYQWLYWHPFHLQYFTQDSNLWEISFCYNSIPCHWIAAKFCTCHDSCAVVTCAKFCSNHLFEIWMRPKSIFHQIWKLAWKIISAMDSMLLWLACQSRSHSCMSDHASKGSSDILTQIFAQDEFLNGPGQFAIEQGKWASVCTPDHIYQVYKFTPNHIYQVYK